MTLDTDPGAALRDAIGVEPPMRLAVTTVIEQGASLRRRRRVVGVAQTLGIVVLLGVGVVWLLGKPAPLGATAPSQTSAPAASSTPTRTTVESPGSAPEAALTRLSRVVQSASREGWTFDWSQQEASSVDGTVDDGSGPSRILVSVMRQGFLQVHPCKDPEFRMGAPCVERSVGGGAVLSTRGLPDTAPSVDGQAVTIAVTLAYPDGSGVTAESGNYAAPSLPNVLIGGSAVPTTKATRTAPAYSPVELEDLVLAVNSAMK
jgi:hypothetical protein